MSENQTWCITRRQTVERRYAVEAPCYHDALDRLRMAEDDGKAPERYSVGKAYPIGEVEFAQAGLTEVGPAMVADSGPRTIERGPEGFSSFKVLRDWFVEIIRDDRTFSIPQRDADPGGYGLSIERLGAYIGQHNCLGFAVKYGWAAASNGDSLWCAVQPHRNDALVLAYHLDKKERQRTEARIEELRAEGKLPAFLGGDA